MIARLRVEVIREQGECYDRSPLNSASAVAELMADMRRLDREHLRIIAVNTKNVPIGVETVAIGTLNSASIHPREVFKALILANAAGFFVVHNHPSGDPKPSPEDLAIIARLRDVGKLLGIALIDSIIIGDENRGFYSLLAD